MKVNQLLQALKQMPLEGDVVLRDPDNPDRTVALDIYDTTRIRSIDPPSHLILEAKGLKKK